MNKKPFLFILLLAVMVSLSACLQANEIQKLLKANTLAPTPASTPKAITTGMYDGQVYTNDFFGLSFRIPEGYTPLSKQQIMRVFKVAAEMVGNGDEMEQGLDEQKMFFLTMVVKDPDFATVDNPNFNVICENFELSGLQYDSLLEYAMAAHEYSLESNPYIVENGDITLTTINGVEFAVSDQTVCNQGITMYQRNCSTLKNGYAIVFTLTWFTDEELAELEKFTDTIKLVS
jgi:hypothetical protein